MTLPFGLKNPVIQKHFGRPMVKENKKIGNIEMIFCINHNLTNYYIVYIDQVIQKTRSQVYYFPRNILSETNLYD